MPHAAPLRAACLLFLQCAHAGENLEHGVDPKLLAAGTAVSSQEIPCPDAYARKSANGFDKNLAENPHLKFFAYDVAEPDSWAQLKGFEGCVSGRQLPRLSVEDKSWPKIADLWAILREAYQKLGQFCFQNQWQDSPWLENRPTKVSATVLASNPQETRPMSFMVDDSSPDQKIQEPCTALSSAAFMEVAIHTCNLDSFPEMQMWNWKNELIAASSVLAFTSFSSSACPTGLTRQFDRSGMSVFFYLVHQAQMRMLTTNWDDDRLKVLLSFRNWHLECPFNHCFSWAQDARTPVRDWLAVIQTDPTSWWNGWSSNHNDLEWEVPPYELSIIGLLMVNLRHVLHPEYFGTSLIGFYEKICITMVDSFMGINMVGEAVKPYLCAADGTFAQALSGEFYKAPLDIGSALADVAEVIELLAEVIYWYEEWHKFDDWVVRGALQQDSECWKWPHANSQRTLALMTKKLIDMFGKLEGNSARAPLTAAQKDHAWSNLMQIEDNFVALNNSMTMLLRTNEVNLCKVFELVKAGAGTVGGKLTPTPLSILSLEKLHQDLPVYLGKEDPLLGCHMEGRNPMTCVPKEEDDTTYGGCAYRFTWLTEEVTGLNTTLLKRIGVRTGYHNVDAAIEAGVEFETCSTELVITGKLKIQRTGSDDGVPAEDSWLCGAFSPPITREVKIRTEFDVSAYAYVRGYLDRFFDTGGLRPVDVAVPRMDVGCHGMEVRIGDDSGGLLDAAIDAIVNGVSSLVMGQALSTICGEIDREIKATLPGEVEKISEMWGSLVHETFALDRSRRLAWDSNESIECPAPGQTGRWKDGSYAISAARGPPRVPAAALVLAGAALLRRLGAR